MHLFRAIGKRAWIALIAGALGLTTAGCGSLSFEENVGLGILGSTILGAQSPSHEIQQIYYLGSFDPQGQLPPTAATWSRSPTGR